MGWNILSTEIGRTCAIFKHRDHPTVPGPLPVSLCLQVQHLHALSGMIMGHRCFLPLGLPTPSPWSHLTLFLFFVWPHPPLELVERRLSAFGWLSATLNESYCWWATTTQKDLCVTEVSRGIHFTFIADLSYSSETPLLVGDRVWLAELFFNYNKTFC